MDVGTVEHREKNIQREHVKGLGDREFDTYPDRQANDSK